MKTIFQGLAIILLACNVTGCTHVPKYSKFFLVDANGNKQGPYEIEHEQKLTIDGKIFTAYVPEMVTETNRVIRQMKKIIIPEIRFHDVNINDAVYFLSKRGVRFISPGSPTMESTNNVPDEKTPNITFEAENISLFEALCIVCSVAKIDWCVVGSGVLLKPKNKVQQ